ncbi:hypothetical protein EST38_g2220 [Candolleomyces aberdarensis]|uniref:Uncharacterized protein n=1 Tax=Candolleomyces aberdarensis TaxID=2316362 RepID=A0A4Q2DX97_9AGAR|nr:hypothetical protein EST38_g2220 [Candolleomyces aberdarensis]
MSNRRNSLHPEVPPHMLSRESALAGALVDFILPPGSQNDRARTITNVPRYTPVKPWARRKMPIEVTFEKEGELGKGLGIRLRDLVDKPEKVGMIGPDHPALKDTTPGKTVGLFLAWPGTDVPPKQFWVDVLDKSGKDVTRLEHDLGKPDCVSFDSLVLKKVFSEFESQLEVEIAVRAC